MHTNSIHYLRGAPCVCVRSSILLYLSIWLTRQQIRLIIWHWPVRVREWHARNMVESKLFITFFESVSIVLQADMWIRTINWLLINRISYILWNVNIASRWLGRCSYHLFTSNFLYLYVCDVSVVTSNWLRIRHTHTHLSQNTISFIAVKFI